MSAPIWWSSRGALDAETLPRVVETWVAGRRVWETHQRTASGQRVFKIAARDLGELRPGLSLDNVSELIEQVEGS